MFDALLPFLLLAAIALPALTGRWVYRAARSRGADRPLYRAIAVTLLLLATPPTAFLLIAATLGGDAPVLVLAPLALLALAAVLFAAGDRWDYAALPRSVE